MTSKWHTYKQLLQETARIYDPKKRTIARLQGLPDFRKGRVGSLSYFYDTYFRSLRTYDRISQCTQVPFMPTGKRTPTMPENGAVVSSK